MQIITTSDRPDLDEQSQAALLADWPEFVLHDRCAPELMGRAWRSFPAYDVRVLEDGTVSAGGWAVPLRWDGTADTLPDGYDGALAAAIAGHENSVPPDTLCVMAVAVRPDRQRAGLSGQVITALRSRAQQAGLEKVVVPVRPTLKSRYPLTPMKNFARWTRSDGLHIDPWIRTHQRLGASILGPARRSMIVTGTIAHWETWTGMAFPETGQYVVPGALDLVRIDTERDLGTYTETNLWMRHALCTAASTRVRPGPRYEHPQHGRKATVRSGNSYRSSRTDRWFPSPGDSVPDGWHRPRKSGIGPVRVAICLCRKPGACFPCSSPGPPAPKASDPANLVALFAGRGTMAVAPSQGAVPAGPPRRARGLKVVRVATVTVLVVGLVITGVLTVVTFRGHQRTERTLLDLQTTLIADAGEAEDQLYVEDHLGGAATLAAATDGNAAMFRQAISTAVGGQNAFVTGSLWRLTGSSPQLITEAGAQPLAPVTAALLRQAEVSRPFFVTELESSGVLHLAFAAAASGAGGTFVAYAEEPLPANRRITEPAGSPVASLNLAVYLGRSQTSSTLLETDSSAPLPLRGTTDTTRIAFGNTVLTITTSPRTSLSGVTGEILPWAIAGGGVLVTFLAALLTERLIRRREAAEQLTSEVSQLYLEQRSVAETLQHALLPQRLPDIPGVEIAVRYIAGAIGVDIGGDWYDVVQLDDHRFVFIVGDVSGRGVRAAAVMASLQFAGRAYAQEGYSPAMILERLSRSVDIERDDHFATVLCGLADVTARTMVLANAGHLPPLILSGGEARFVTTRPGPPVGVPRKVPLVPAEVTMTAGDVLVAYTDGLVERRGEMLDVGLKRLQTAASRDSSSLDNMLGSIVTELSGDTPTDDIALIGLKWLN